MQGVEVQACRIDEASCSLCKVRRALTVKIRANSCYSPYRLKACVKGEPLCRHLSTAKVAPCCIVYV